MLKTIGLLLVFLSPLVLPAQDGTIIEKNMYTLHDSVWTKIKNIDADLAKRIKDSIDFYRITYISDGLKVTGYIAEPKANGKYPCIISNRGGNRDFGMWNPVSIVYFLGQMASWDYVVIASQYRGNDGGEGREEFGGKEVDDIFNLIPVLENNPKADTSRIGMEGTSRGGMMTYLSLKRSCRFKAAVITAGMADAFLNTASRPEMDKTVFGELVPDYATNKEEALKARSVVYWADQLCKTTPLLLMQGSADWRVLPEESLEVVNKLYAAKQPLRFIFFEGADHGIHEWRDERFSQTRRHFDYYLRDGNKWPSMEKHGK
ncbi:MAG: prolyl oligopeptidase family serine peptidase [Saprospiraceae bacterium]